MRNPGLEALTPKRRKIVAVKRDATIDKRLTHSLHFAPGFTATPNVVAA